MRKILATTLLPLLIWTVTSTAQNLEHEKLPPVHHAPNREFHMVNVNLSFKFNMKNREVFGTAVETIVPLRVNYDTLHLEAIGMTIDKIEMGGKSLGYTYDGKVLSIGLGRDYGLNDTLTYTIVYRTYPKKGIFFVEPDKAYPNRIPEVWSQSEMEDARYWFPCHDYPDDFMTSSVTATVPEDWVVVSNGVLAKVTTDRTDETKTFHWVENKPHVIYLISIVAGKFAVLHAQYGNIPIYYYVPPADTADAIEDFSHTPDILKFFSHVTGYQYPWQKLALSAVADFTFGGMENVSAITLTDNTLHGPDANPQVSTTNLVSHETAHQWFGDLLTCKTWSNAWLNEGFATYFEALYGKHAFGKDHFEYEMYHNHRQVIAADKFERRPTVYNRYFSSVDMFGTYIYQRGASILYMLRGILGKRLFFKAIRHYVKEFKHRNVDSNDFANAVREATGYNLYWFFDEWLYKGGQPDFNVSYDYSDASHQLVLHVEQTQKVDSITPVYKMPVDIYIVTPAEKITRKIWVDSLSNTYTFGVAQKPMMVNFDENDYLLKEMKFKKSTTELAYELEHDPNVVGRIRVAEQLAEDKSDTALSLLAKGAKDQKFWGVRLECATLLSGFKGGAARESLVSALNDKDPRVVVAAANALGELSKTSGKKDKKLAGLLRQVYETRRNYFVRAAALGAIAATEGKGAESLIENALKVNSYQQVIRRSALSALATIDSSRAYSEAVAFSRYGEPHSIRIDGIREMTTLGPKRAETLNLLKQYASDPYIWARMVAIYSLGRVGTQEVVPLLHEREKIENDGRLKAAIERAMSSIEQREKEDLTRKRGRKL